MIGSSNATRALGFFKGLWRGVRRVRGERFVLVALGGLPFVDGGVSGASRASSRWPVAETCSVDRVYEQIPVPAGAAASYYGGELQEISELYVPAKLKPGSYAVTVSRKANNLYRVDGKALYIRTRLCMNFAFSEDAVLKISGMQGELVFE